MTRAYGRIRQARSRKEVHAARCRRSCSRIQGKHWHGLCGLCAPNLQNLLPVQLTTQLSVAMAAHAHTEDPGPFPSRHPGCRVRVHALGCYLVLCQCSHRRLRRLVITRLAPQLAGQSPPRAPRARRRLRSPTATRLSGSRRVALSPSLVGGGAAACIAAVACVAPPFVGVPLLGLACSPRREE